MALSLEIVVVIVLAAVTVIAAVLLVCLIRFIKKRNELVAQVGVFHPRDSGSFEATFHNPNASPITAPTFADPNHTFNPTYADDALAETAADITTATATTTPGKSLFSPGRGSMHLYTPRERVARPAFEDDDDDDDDDDGDDGDDGDDAEWAFPPSAAVQPGTVAMSAAKQPRPSRAHRHSGRPQPPLPDVGDDFVTPALLRAITAISTPDDEFYLIVVQAEPGFVVAGVCVCLSMSVSVSVSVSVDVDVDVAVHMRLCIFLSCQVAELNPLFLPPSPNGCTTEPRLLTFPYVPGFDGLGITLAGSSPVRIMTVDPGEEAQWGEGAVLCFASIRTAMWLMSPTPLHSLTHTHTHTHSTPVCREPR